jgi:hypothetical protein
MLRNDKLSILAQMREHFTQQGWPQDDLDRFRMEDGDNDPGGDDNGDGDDAGGDDNGDGDGDDKLGDAGKKAIDAMKAQRNAERDRRRAFEQTLSKHGVSADKLDELLSTLKKSGNDEPTAEQIRAEARSEARAESARERASDKIEARAAAKFADPEVVSALLARRLNDFIDDGNVDTEAIDEALAELLEKKPHLAKNASGGRRFEGGADSGDRGSGGKSKPASLEEAIAQELAGSKK